MAARTRVDGDRIAALDAWYQSLATPVQRATIGAYTTTGVAIAKTTTTASATMTIRTTRHMAVTLTQVTQ